MKPIDIEIQIADEFSDSDGSAKSGHENAAVDGGSSKAQSGSASADSSRGGHENYMFGDIHVFVD